MNNDLIIIGSGGHSNSVIEVIEETKIYDNIYFVDDNYKKLKNLSNKKFLGKVSDLKKFKKYSSSVFVALGDNSIRECIIKQVLDYDFKLINVISNTSIVSNSAKLAKGIFIGKSCIINANTKIGKGSIINTNSSIDHDCKIGNYCHIAPGCLLLGGVKISNNTFLGARTTVLNNVSIGQKSKIGAVSLVNKNLNKYSVGFGIPFKIKSK